MKISITIPAYNEEKRIGKTLKTYSTYFEELRKDKKLDYEILVVINNTTDKTENIVKKFVKTNKRIKYLNLKSGGKGYAVVEGFKDSLKRKNDLVGFVDADMATSPEEYYKLITELKNCDGVIASRYVKNAVIKPRPSISRLIAKRMFNFLVRGILFLPYNDTQCGAKIFKREAISKVVNLITMSKWAFDVDLLYTLRKKGFKVKEIPTVWVDKEYSKINFWSAGPWMALGVIRLRLLDSRLKRIVLLYNKFYSHRKVFKW